MRTKEKKGPVRNFTFLKSADKELTERSADTGRTMTMVLEDLLLGRRQFNPETERFLQSEIERTGRSRNEIIEAAMVAYQAAGHPSNDQLQIGFQHPASSKTDNDRRAGIAIAERELERRKARRE